MKLEKVKCLLVVQDMARAVKFYTEVFHLNEGYVSDYWSELLFGDAIIALHGGGDGGIQVTSLSLQVDNLGAACAAIRAAGGSILTMPIQRPGEPIKLATFQDLEGNQVMLTEYVGTGG